jgi:hypothetical protein
MNRDFAEMLSALSEAGAEFLIVGAHALAAHGLPRATGDLDIWVRPTGENAGRVLEALRAFRAPLHDLTERTWFVGTVFQIGVVPTGSISDRDQRRDLRRGLTRRSPSTSSSSDYLPDRADLAANKQSGRPMTSRTWRPWKATSRLLARRAGARGCDEERGPASSRCGQRAN